MIKISKQMLLRMQEVHKTDQAIANLFNCSRQAVHQLRVKYGIPKLKDKYYVRDSKIYKEMKNKSSKYVSEKYGITVSHVYRILRNLNDKR